MVGDVADGRAVRFDPVAERRPLWVTDPARMEADPIRHSVVSVSRKEGWHGSSRTSTGDSGAEMNRAIRSSSDPSGDAGPHTTIFDWGRNMGAKNISPWMWSR